MKSCYKVNDQQDLAGVSPDRKLETKFQRKRERTMSDVVVIPFYRNNSGHGAVKQLRYATSSYPEDLVQRLLNIISDLFCVTDYINICNIIDFLSLRVDNLLDAMDDATIADNLDEVELAIVDHIRDSFIQAKYDPERKLNDRFLRWHTHKMVVDPEFCMVDLQSPNDLYRVDEIESRKCDKAALMQFLIDLDRINDFYINSDLCQLLQLSDYRFNKRFDYYIEDFADLCNIVQQSLYYTYKGKVYLNVSDAIKYMPRTLIYEFKGTDDFFLSTLKSLCLKFNFCQEIQTLAYFKTFIDAIEFLLYKDAKRLEFQTAYENGAPTNLQVALFGVDYDAIDDIITDKVGVMIDESKEVIEKNTKEATAKLVEALKSSMEGFTDKMTDTLNSNLAPVRDKVTVASDCFTEKLQTPMINGMLSGIVSTIGMADYVASLCLPEQLMLPAAWMVLSYYFLKKRGKAGRIVAAVIVAGTSGKYIYDNGVDMHALALSALGAYLLFKLYNYEENEVVLQSDDSDSLKTIGNLFSNLDDFSKRLDKLAKTIKNTTYLSEVIVRLKNWLTDIYNATLGKYCGFPLLDSYSMFEENVAKFLREAREFIDMYDGKKLGLTISSFKLVSDMVAHGEEILKMMTSTRDKAHHVRIFSDVLYRLKEIKRVMNQLRLGSGGNKMEPVHLCFRGPPGTFKTVLVDSTIAAAVSIAGTSEQVTQFQNNRRSVVYYRNSSHDHWDAYIETNVLVMVIDDIFQANEDYLQGSTEAWDTIQTVNANPLVLKQAHLDNKGAVEFRAPFVITTTNNITLTDIKSIKHIDALKRRFHLNYAPIPKPEYRKTKESYVNDEFWSWEFDHSKLPITPGYTGDPMTLVDHDMFLFVPLDIHGAKIGEPITFLEVVEQMRVLYNKKFNEQYRANEQYVDIVQKLRTFINENPGVPLTEAADKVKPHRKLQLRANQIVERLLNSLEKQTPPVSDPLELEALTIIREKSLTVLREDPTILTHMSRKGMELILEAFGISNGDAYCPICWREGLLVKGECTELCRLCKNGHSFEIDSDWNEDDEAIQMEAVENAERLFKETVLQYDMANTHEFTKNLLRSFSYDERAMLAVRDEVRAFIKLLPEDTDRRLLQDFLLISHLVAHAKEIPGSGFLSEYNRFYVAFIIYSKDKDLFEKIYFDKEFDTYVRADWFDPEHGIEKFHAILSAKGIFDGFKDKLKTSITYMQAVIKTLADSKLGSLIALVSVTTTGALTLYNIYKMFHHDEEIVPSHDDDAMEKFTAMLKENYEKSLQGSYHSSHKMVKSNIKGRKGYDFKQAMRNTPTNVVPTTGLQGSSTSPNEYFRKLSNSHMGMMFFKEEKYTFRGYFMFLNSNFILMPLHFLGMLYQKHTLYPNADLLFAAVDGTVECQIPSTKITEFLDQSFDGEKLSLGHGVILPLASKRAKSDAIQRFLKEEDFQNLPTHFDIELDLCMKPTTYRSNAVLRQITVSDFYVDRTIEYLAQTVEGDCGSPIYMIDAKTMPRVIIGIHWAGCKDLKRGYGGVITQEAIHEAICNHSQDTISLQGPIHLEPSNEGLFKNKFNILGRIKAGPKHSPYVYKPDIIPSALYNYGNGESIKRVARTCPSKDGAIDPFANALNKFPTEPITYNTKALDRAVKDYTNMLYSIPFPENQRRVYTTEEALWGIEGNEYWGSMPLKTSSGYPTKAYPEHMQIKKILLKERDPTSEAFRKFDDQLKIVEDNARKGKRMLWVFTVNLKVELRKLQKWLDGDTRLFCGAPFAYCVVFRKYFGAFFTFFVANRHVNESAVGMNPYSTEWDVMTRDLSKFSKNKRKFKAKALDYAKFDISQKIDLLWFIFHIMNGWYNDEHTDVRKVLWLEMVNSRHVYMEIIFEWFFSLPSGHPATIFVNSIYGCLAIRYAFFSMYPDYTGHFCEVVALRVVGDDNIMANHPDIDEEFTTPNIAKYVGELGLTVTLDDKDADINAPDRDISEVTFLKRSFEFDDKRDRWVAPLSLETILESPRWTRRNQWKDVIVQNHIHEFYRELSLHSKEVFDKYSADMTRVLRRGVIPGIIVDFDYESNRNTVLETWHEYSPDISIDDDELDLSFIMGSAPYVGLQSLGAEHPEELFDPSTHDESGFKVREDCVSSKSQDTYPRGGVLVDKTQGLNPCSYVLGSTHRKRIRPGQTENLKTIPVTLQSSGRFGADAMDDAMDVSQTVGTTHFINEAITVEDNIVPTSDTVLAEAETSGISISEDLKQFLARPRKLTVSSNLLQTGDTVNTFSPFIVPFDIFDNVQIGNKLKGYHGIRYTTVFTLVVNANKFQQGRYMLCAVPMGGCRTTAGTNGPAWVNAHLCTLVQRTQVPRVEIDLACDTTAVLRLPYNSALDYYPLTAMADPNRYGTSYYVRLFPYQPLAYGTGSINATYSLWVHLEDVELIAAAVPATGLQAPDESKVERDGKDAGPISSVALKVSKAAKFFTPLPVVGAYATSLSWVADIVGNAAKVFGWSNPTNLDKEMRVQRYSSAYANNVDKIDNSLMLSLVSDNHVRPTTTSRLDSKDELLISDFVGRYSYIYTVNWSTADVEGTELINDTVSALRNVLTGTPGAGTTWYSMGPLSFVASNFKFWRGTILYKFKIVKTDFHSGRVALAFTPNSARTTTTGLTYATSDYCYREIIDIRESNEFTFAIPFVSHTPYKTGAGGQDSSTGTLKMFVVDPLRAPDTVNGTIQFLVEMAGGPDMEFQVLDQNYLTPVHDVTLQGLCEEPPRPLGNSQQTVFQLGTAADCFGERIISLRQLCKRTNWLKRNSRPVPDFHFNVQPNSFVTAAVDSGSGGIFISQPSDFLGTLMSCFTYQKGSINLKGMCHIGSFEGIGNITPYGLITATLVPITTTQITKYIAAPNSSVFGTAYTIADLKSRFQYARFIHENYIVEVNVPNSHFVRKTPNCDQQLRYTTTTANYLVGAGSLARRMAVNFTGDIEDPDAVDTSRFNFTIGRSGGDDFDLFDYISLPPVAVPLASDTFYT